MDGKELRMWIARVKEWASGGYENIQEEADADAAQAEEWVPPPGSRLQSAGRRQQRLQAAEDAGERRAQREAEADPQRGQGGGREVAFLRNEDGREEQLRARPPGFQADPDGAQEPDEHGLLGISP